ncbi:collagen alpha-4(VI) chain-like isoform X5 [Biomphalaria glabrata]|uniref:Collagen alpha-4(VI) chain-like isoform X5 n=1 Tax=Biomphalaria glabrata TaxID=6526 RepID=A0A9W3A4J0_BIOGL|nr:collagen alpha-4(VI) chain-like isoform X5 [Biomphalaria glabrata]
MKQFCFILFIPGIILWILFSVNLSDGHKICVEQLDLVVILDTSKSVGEKNFQKCIFFLEGVVANLSIAPDSVRVALLRYSDKAQVVSYLNDDMEKQEKLKAVGSIQYIEGSTYTDLALELTNEEVLSPERGDRSNVSDLVVLITDGESSNKSSTKNQSVKLKNRNNLKIFTLGIGSEIDDEELEAIATSNDLSLILESFENLAEIIAPMTSVTCSGGSVLDPTEPFNEQTTELGGRSRELDLIIILDTSVREDCFMANINFTETLLEELPISSDLVRVALGYHSHQVQIASYLNESTNKEDKLKEVLRMKELTLSQTLNKSSQISQLDVLEGDRSDVADIIMFIKSDLFISSNLTINETKIYSIGVLNISNAQDWLKASNLSNVSFIVDSFTSPKDVANYLMTTSTSGITTRRYLVVTVHQRTSFQNLEIELSDKPVGDVNNATFLTYLGISIAIIVAALAIVVALATLYRKKQNKNCADNP